MALQHDIEKFGLVFQNAYSRIGECKYYNNLYPYTSYPEADYSDPDQRPPLFSNQRRHLQD